MRFQKVAYLHTYTPYAFFIGLSQYRRIKCAVNVGEKKRVTARMYLVRLYRTRLTLRRVEFGRKNLIEKSLLYRVLQSITAAIWWTRVR